MKPKDLVKLLKQKGWEIDRIDGSHFIMVHPTEKGRAEITWRRQFP
jgi:predicted RNA binding protein YcfA (HicA-like mRNA interferase family)